MRCPCLLNACYMLGPSKGDECCDGNSERWAWGRGALGGRAGMRQTLNYRTLILKEDL